MNITTILGMMLGFTIIVFAVAFGTATPEIYWNLPGLVIVIGGTMAATLFSYPMGEIVNVVKVFFIVLKNERRYSHDDIEEIVDISKKWFNSDIRELEHTIVQIRNPFLRNGLQMLADKAPIEDVIELLQWRIAKLKARETAEAQIYRSMATYAPAFGMLGTLFGLVGMLHNLGDADFAATGRNMAIALITTFYGIMLSNLIFKPIAIKFERRTEKRVIVMNLVLEGITLMSQRRSPSFIRSYLDYLIANYEDELAYNK